MRKILAGLGVGFFIAVALTKPTAFDPLFAIAANVSQSVQAQVR